MPLATPVAVSVVPFTGALAILFDPELDPACSRYDSGAQPAAGAVHVKTTVDPLVTACRLVGGLGAEPQVPTVNAISVDGALTTPVAALRTRT